MDKFTLISLAINIKTNKLVNVINSGLVGIGDLKNNREDINKGLSLIAKTNLKNGYLSVDIVGLRNDTKKKVIWVEPI